MTQFKIHNQVLIQLLRITAERETMDYIIQEMKQDLDDDMPAEELVRAFAKAPDTVSYTHLDVYKRQIYNDTVSVSKSAPNMDADMVAALQEAFINIGNTPEGKEVIAIYSHNGYQKAQSSDYDNERAAQQLIQELTAN